MIAEMLTAQKWLLKNLKEKYPNIAKLPKMSLSEMFAVADKTNPFSVNPCPNGVALRERLDKNQQLAEVVGGTLDYLFEPELACKMIEDPTLYRLRMATWMGEDRPLEFIVENLLKDGSNLSFVETGDELVFSCCNTVIDTTDKWNPKHKALDYSVKVVPANKEYFISELEKIRKIQINSVAEECSK